MKPAIAKAIINASEVIGLSLEHRTDYSGRGMHGNDTHAIIGNPSEFLQACCYAAGTLDQTNLAEHPDGETPEDETHDLDEFCQEMTELRTDTMGRYDNVWY